MPKTSVLAFLIGASLAPGIASATCSFDGSPGPFVRCVYDETVALWDAIDLIQIEVTLLQRDVADLQSEVTAVRDDVATIYTDLCDRVTLAEPMDYEAINAELGANPEGYGICGEGSHVCNSNEANIYGVLGACSMEQAWIVGGFSNNENHRRSVWSGDNSTQCPVGKYPTWFWDYLNYKGRVHCMPEEEIYPVACCIDL